MIRIGVDFGGTKIEAAALDAQGRFQARVRVATPSDYIDRLGRALAVVADLPAAIAPHVFSDVFDTPITKALHGDSSGVRGAAWLWPLEPGG